MLAVESVERLLGEENCANHALAKGVLRCIDDRSHRLVALQKGLHLREEVREDVDVDATLLV